jgi:hypothetical protein
MKGKCAVALSLFTLGLPAPYLCTYCPDKEFGKRQKKVDLFILLLQQVSFYCTNRAKETVALKETILLSMYVVLLT